MRLVNPFKRSDNDAAVSSPQPGPSELADDGFREITENSENLESFDRPYDRPERNDTKGNKNNLTLKLPFFERADTTSSASSRKSHDTGDYAMSVVDSGVYLPPSPNEKEAFWSGPRKSYQSPLSTISLKTSSEHEKRERERASAEIEAFGITRASFDSYRRSFDICAKSPVSPTKGEYTRQSLDSAGRHMPPPTRTRNILKNRFPSEDESFEEITLAEEREMHPSLTAANPVPVRKRPFFKFGGNSQAAQIQATATPATDSPSQSSAQSTTNRLLGRMRAPGTQGGEMKPVENDVEET